MVKIDELYFPWEVEDRRRFRQRATASLPKCKQCNNVVGLGNETGICTACQRRNQDEARERALKDLADKLLGGRCPACMQFVDAHGECGCRPF